MENQLKNFDKLKLAIRNAKRMPLNDRAYTRWGYRGNEPVSDDFTLEEIQSIIRSGDPEALRHLSRYFYRTNSNYRNNIDFLAHLFLYEHAVVPVYEEGKGSKTQIIKAFYNACEFIEKLDLVNTLGRITTEWLLNGVYYGILRTDGDSVVIQDLPISYCRNRFKDFNNLDILEFNLVYFEHIPDAEMREEAVRTFPVIVQQAWARWKASKLLKDQWVPLPAAAGGISFSFSHDPIPLLIASIPELKKLDDAVGREEKRDENELYKLLIQRMPIDSKGELVFQLDEVADIHSSVASMLSDIDTVDVLTTFGETDLESLQESSSATQSVDRIAKYKSNAWSALGRGMILFNPENSSTLAYQIKKDESLMLAYISVYETWIKFHLNDRFSRKGLTFDFEILPITVFNRNELQQAYFRGAQYGYSKMVAGVAMGIKQRDQLSLMNFENEFLEMSSKMIPLQSSYTTPGGTVAQEENSAKNTTKSVKTQDITNTGGRPELPDEQKSEKTQANIAAMG